ncbi:hypothetical protein [Halalkalibacter krulwichiae]|uniref:YqgU-like 6-bladed beta-propeller domain-containing protein n=1 Tax=Halalkalibacter krulwichiae TaxID=199441 RepID=A0A1X9M7L1_9BACI|nr:hypothetical protein [Halalkalibacter krulwichiae]ARK29396.1 hypothetical protein BkAM31D_05760 [Halalkalibacter krulwichiae]
MRIILVIITVFILSACTNGPLEIQPSPKSYSNIPEKKEVPLSFYTGSAIHSIQSTKRVVEVLNWFDEENILFLEENIDGSTIYKHNFITGESFVFFEEAGWIIDVIANVDDSYFAIQVFNKQEEVEVIIVNQNGEKELQIKEFGEDYTIFWNEYEPDQFMMIAYLPNWDYETFFVEVGAGKIKPIELEQSYIQWISSNTVAFIKWNEYEPSFHAPLVKTNIETKETTLWKEDVIAYMSFPDGLSLTVQLDNESDLFSTYRFYRNEKLISELEIPILNTFSEQWWIPYYSYDDKNEIFYFLRPKSSGDFITYSDGYDLIGYHIGSNSEQKITTLDQHVPIKVSPNGSMILMGERFENVLDIHDGLTIPVWEE